MAADLIVVDRDPLQVGVNELAQTQTLATTLRGEFVFDGDGGEEAFGPRPIRGMSGDGLSTYCWTLATIGSQGAGRPTSTSHHRSGIQSGLFQPFSASRNT